METVVALHHVFCFVHARCESTCLYCRTLGEGAALTYPHFVVPLYRTVDAVARYKPYKP